MSIDIAIVGAGLTGLAAAYRLSRHFSVTVFEETGAPGGLASTLEVSAERLERFYHHLFANDRVFLELCRELGIIDAVEWFEPNNAVFIDNRLYPFTTPMDLLRFTPLRFVSRVRTGLLTLASGLVRDYGPYEKVTAREWLIRRAGKDSFEKIWEPLLVSKFEDDASLVSGTWIWNKLKLRGSSREKNLGREMLGYLKGGFETLISRLTYAVADAGGRILYNSRTKGIERRPDGRFILDGGSGVFDRVLFTASPGILAEMPSPLPSDFSGRLAALRSKANICMILELDRSLSPYYWITVAQRDIPFVLAIEHTRLVGMRKYGAHIVYLSRYLDPGNPLFTMSDDEIEERFLRGLAAVFPGFSREWIRRTTVSRARYAQPVVTKEYANIMPPVKTPVPGLYLATMSQIYPEDRGLNHAVRLGYGAADEILSDI
jgi:protoporphyrinogen oxidase